MKPVKRLRTRISLARTAMYHAALGRITMYDSIYTANLPKGAAAYAGYVAGNWPTYSAMVAEFEKTGAYLLSIDPFGTNFAHCLDDEPGDAGNGSIAAWVKKVKAGGVKVPVIYTSAANVQNVINVCMEDLGLTRQEFLVWSAHYTYSAHICAPAVCGYAAADATQWSDEGPNGCDVSSVASYFFPWTLGQSTPTPPAPPKPPTPPGPQPYPAPSAVAIDNTVKGVAWEPVTVDGRLILDYTVQVVELNGTIAQTHTTTQPNIVLTGLINGWQYKVLVWANGGPVAPPHAELDITA
jgi:hypothetical protein